MAQLPIRRSAGQAMGQKNLGYGHMEGNDSGRNPGYARGGSVKAATSKTMNGGIGKSAHGQTHKSHGFKDGVVHQKTGGVGTGGARTGGGSGKTSGSSGPSTNQFGGGMPSGKGSSLGRW